MIFSLLSSKVFNLLWKKSIGTVGIGVGEKLIHLQLLYFKANEFHLYVSRKRMRAKALRCYVVGKHEGGEGCLATLVAECSVQGLAVLGKSS